MKPIRSLNVFDSGCLADCGMCMSFVYKCPKKWGTAVNFGLCDDLLQGDSGGDNE